MTRISFDALRAAWLVVIFPLQTSLDDEPFQERSASSTTTAGRCWNYLLLLHIHNIIRPLSARGRPSTSRTRLSLTRIPGSPDVLPPSPWIQRCLKGHHLYHRLRSFTRYRPRCRGLYTAARRHMHARVTERYTPVVHRRDAPVLADTRRLSHRVDDNIIVRAPSASCVRRSRGVVCRCSYLGEEG